MIGMVDMRNRIIEMIREICQDVALEDIGDDTELIGKGCLLDSLAFLSLVLGIEQEFGIEIPFDEYSPEEFTIFGNFVAICLASLPAK